MKFFDRNRLILVLLVLSLLLNVAIVGYLSWSGGLRRIFVRMDLAEPPKTREAFQKEMEERYRKYPNTDAEVVIAGDSLVAEGPWSELLGEIHNRGIGGDTTAALLGRLDEILEAKPVRILLLIGTNDLAIAVPEAQILRNYRKLLERIRQESPKTIVTVISVLPINTTFPKKTTQTNAQIQSLNARLKELVGEFPGVRFLDVSSALLDDAGELRREFTLDGVHLSVDGYLALRKPLQEATSR